MKVVYNMSDLFLKNQIIQAQNKIESLQIIYLHTKTIIKLIIKLTEFIAICFLST